MGLGRKGVAVQMMTMYLSIAMEKIYPNKACDQVPYSNPMDEPSYNIFEYAVK